MFNKFVKTQFEKNIKKIRFDNGGGGVHIKSHA